MRPRIVGMLAAGSVVCGALAVGCSQDASTGVISGTVTLDGAPLKTGQIRFVPVDGQSPTAGAVIAEGKYSTTVAPGAKTVEITSPKEGPAREMYDNAPPPPTSNAGSDLVPAKYNAQTELKIEVLPGAAPHNFELLSK